jgi:hypothetical protein
MLCIAISKRSTTPSRNSKVLYRTASQLRSFFSLLPYLYFLDSPVLVNSTSFTTCGGLRPYNALLLGVQLRHKVCPSPVCSRSYGLTLLCRIIEPLASRCSKFRFKPLDSSSARERLEHIATAEQVPVNPSVISALISTSSGDLRRAITYLQSAARLSSATEPPTPILPEDIQEIAGVVPDHVVRKFAQTLGVDVPGSADEDRKTYKPYPLPVPVGSRRA